jgi:hypothetical protein
MFSAAILKETCCFCWATMVLGNTAKPSDVIAEKVKMLRRFT